MGRLKVIGGAANTAERWGGAALAVLAAPLDPPLVTYNILVGLSIESYHTIKHGCNIKSNVCDSL